MLRVQDSFDRYGTEGEFPITGSCAAVVVTFNRKYLLAECLDALLMQSKALDGIFIVNNASADGTRELLEEREYLKNPVIRYIELPRNLGGAGGFNIGLAAAKEAGAEWIWVMDDDTEPYRDSLEMMESLKNNPKVVAIANLKVDRDGKETSDGLRLFKNSNQSGSDYEHVRFSSFVGLLIRTSAIEKIGLPKSEFFIHNDDTEYCMRLRSVGDIALSRNGIVRHKEMARVQKGRKIFSHMFYQKDIERFCFDYFGHRNYAWIQCHYCKNPFVRYGLLLTRFILFSIAIIAFDSDHRILRMKILAKANVDGVRGRFDNGFPQRLREQLRMCNTGNTE